MGEDQMNAYLSIDIETTGLDSDHHDILELGIVYDDLSQPWQELPRFECLIEQPYHITGDPFALALNQGILWELAGRNRDGSEIEEGQIPTAPPILPADLVSGMVSEWLWDVTDITPSEWGKLTVAGKNYANFDSKFLSRNLNGWDELIPVHHRVIDPGNLYWDFIEDGIKLPSMEKCFERAGIQKNVGHRAVEDALDVVRLVRIHLFGGDHAHGSPE